MPREIPEERGDGMPVTGRARRPGARYLDPASTLIYVLDDRPAEWPDLVPAHIEAGTLAGELVQLREADLGTRLELATWPDA